MPQLLLLLGALIVAFAAVMTAVGAAPSDAPTAVDASPISKPAAKSPKADPTATYTAAGQAAKRAKKIGRQHTPSPLIIPQQQIPLRFSHRLHVGDAACTDCHVDAPNSVRASDNNLPKEGACFECHDVEEGIEDPEEAYPPSSCSTCHPGYTPKFPEDADVTETHLAQPHPIAAHLPTPNLKFNHRVHVQNGVECTTCHGNLDDIDFATRENALPTMGTCLSCHDGKQAPSECRTCHITNPDGRLKTDLEGGKLMPSGWYNADAHDERWLTHHAEAARQADGTCESCHTPKDCVDCHNGIRKPLKIHPNNWVLQHATAARKNSPDCASCHRSQTFCVTCHTQSKVVGGIDADPANRPPERLKFHPEGWADFGTRGANHHAHQAQRNIRTCVSCHSEQTCLGCHSTATASVSPHPPGFGTSARCGRMLAANPRVCSKCHSPNDAALQLCR